MPKRVIIAGGGTGGHIFPALSIAGALKKRDPGIDLLFVGARGRMEMSKVPEAGYRIIGLNIAGWDRGNFWKNLGLPIKVLGALWQAGQVLRKFRADSVVGVGGYASFPVLLLAQISGIPTLILEQNSYAGRTNRMIGRRASRICVAFEGMERYFPRDRIVFTGNPVREQIARNKSSRSEALKYFGLQEERRTLLATGGSLGALSINEALRANLKILLSTGVQLIWQTGNSFFGKASDAIKGRESYLKVFPFIDRMDYAYAAADAVICRAGAITLAEICLAGKAAVLVPYPYAAEDHQTLNARYLVRRDAALMIRDADAMTGLMPKALHLATDATMREILESKIRPLGIADASDRISRVILELMDSQANKRS